MTSTQSTGVGLRSSREMSHCKELRIAADVPVEPAAVAQQVAYRDAVHAGIGNPARTDIREQVGEHARIQVQQSVFDQLEHGDRGDRLGHAGDAEQRVGLDRSPGFAVRQAEPPSIDEAAMPDHRNRGAGNVEVAHDAGDDAVVGFHPGDGLPGLRNAVGAGHRSRLGIGGKRRHSENGSKDKGCPDCPTESHRWRLARAQ